MSQDGWMREMLRYEGDRTKVAYRSGLSGADSSNVSSIGSIDVYSLQVETDSLGKQSGKTTLLLYGKFSSSTGVASLYLVRGFVNSYGNQFTSGSTFDAVAIEIPGSTLAATALTDGSKYFSNEVVFDAFGCNFVKAGLFSINAGTVDLYFRRI